MPAALEIITDALDGLVEFAVDRARFRRQLRWNRLARIRMIGMRIPHEEAIHASEKSLDAFNTAVLPIEIAIGRRGEQTVQARGVGAVARNHLVGRDHVAETL